MPHRPTRTDDAPDHDSFLDIVANMVGILIILVMIVGARVKDMPIVASSATEDDAERQTSKELATELARKNSIEDEANKIAGQIERTQREAALRKQHRDWIALRIAAAEKEIELRRQDMDSQSQEAFEQRRKLADLKAELRQAQNRRAYAEAVRAEPTTIENRPTPISESVTGREIHFQIRAGRIAWVPLEELMKRVAVDYRLKASKVFNPVELSGTVGPESGFRARYRIGRQMQQFEFIPESRNLGETIDQSLTDKSTFHRALANLPPDRTTVTLWTYPDSFGSFQQLKKDLYGRGFQVAARPLPHGMHMSASSRGSRSAAQ